MLGYFFIVSKGGTWLRSIWRGAYQCCRGAGVRFPPCHCTRATGPWFSAQVAQRIGGGRLWIWWILWSPRVWGLFESPRLRFERISGRVRACGSFGGGRGFWMVERRLAKNHWLSPSSLVWWRWRRRWSHCVAESGLVFGSVSGSGPGPGSGFARPYVRERFSRTRAIMSVLVVVAVAVAVV